MATAVVFAFRPHSFTARNTGIPVVTGAPSTMADTVTIAINGTFVLLCASFPMKPYVAEAFPVLADTLAIAVVWARQC